MGGSGDGGEACKGDDVQPPSGLQLQLVPERRQLLGESVGDGEHLHGHHRDHLDFNTVELVEAAPRARLHEAGENAADRLWWWW